MEDKITSETTCPTHRIERRAPHFVHFTERVFQRSKLRQTFPSLWRGMVCKDWTVHTSHVEKRPRVA